MNGSVLDVLGIRRGMVVKMIWSLRQVSHVLAASVFLCKLDGR